MCMYVQYITLIDMYIHVCMEVLMLHGYVQWNYSCFVQLIFKPIYICIHTRVHNYKYTCTRWLQLLRFQTESWKYVILYILEISVFVANVHELMHSFRIWKEPPGDRHMNCLNMTHTTHTRTYTLLSICGSYMASDNWMWTDSRTTCSGGRVSSEQERERGQVYTCTCR